MILGHNLGRVKHPHYHLNNLITPGIKLGHEPSLFTSDAWFETGLDDGLDVDGFDDGFIDVKLDEFNVFIDF